MSEEISTASTESVGVSKDIMEEMLKFLPSAQKPRLTTWATPDFKRLKYMLSQHFNITQHMKHLAIIDIIGIPVIEDLSVPDDVMVQARDQYGDSMGEVKWS